MGDKKIWNWILKKTIWGGGTFTCTVDRSSGSSSARVPNHNLMKSSTKSGRQRPFLLLERLTSSNHSHSSLSSCCCSPPVPVNVFKHLDASFGPSKPLSQLQRRYGPLLRVRLRSLCPLKALCFRISTRWSDVTSWSWEFSNSKTSSASYVQTSALGLMHRI